MTKRRTPPDLAALYARRLGRLLAIRDTARRCRDDGWVRVIGRLIDVTCRDLRGIGEAKLVEMVMRRYGE